MTAVRYVYVLESAAIVVIHVSNAVSGNDRPVYSEKSHNQRLQKFDSECELIVMGHG